jgi:hypothetical protein
MIEIKGAMQSPMSGAVSALYKYRNNKSNIENFQKSVNLAYDNLSRLTYNNSMKAFKYIFEKHIQKAENYKKHTSHFGGNRLVFLVDMYGWFYSGLTAVGTKTFNCDDRNIPLCRDIVNIIAKADDIDAVVILFNTNPNYYPTVFAFTPKQAKNNDIGIEVYEYAGDSVYVESFKLKLKDGTISNDDFVLKDNYLSEKAVMLTECDKAFNMIQKGQSCLVKTSFYDTLVLNGIICDNRIAK